MQAEQTPSSLKPTRASFVRALPLSMTVEEVIERGREAGIELQPSDIHAARYYMRQAAVQAATTTTTTSGRTQRIFIPQRDSSPPPPPLDLDDPSDEPEHAPLASTPKHRAGAANAKTRGRKAPATSSSSEALEEQLRVLVLRLGTERTRAIIEDLEALPSRIVR